MKRALLLGLAVASAALGGCSSCGLPSVLPASDTVTDGGVGSFQVTVTSVVDQQGIPFGPGDGSAANPYPFDEYLLTLHVFVQALDQNGLPDTTFSRPVAIQVTPGKLDTDGGPNWLAMNGGVAEGNILVEHLYGAAAVWALDEPPTPVYGNDSTIPTGYDAGPPTLPDGGWPFTFAAGTSQPIYFLTPTIQQMHRTPQCDPVQSFAPSGITGICTNNSQCVDSYGTHYQCWQGLCAGSCDNRTSALDNEFVIMDQVPPAADMVVTTIVNDGFYVSDLLALPVYYPGDPVLTVDWQALPGLFNSVFVYTYSQPTNLYVGNHLTSLAGSVQEFSGDCQLDFPSWITLDAVPSADRIDSHLITEEGDCTISNTGLVGVDRMCGYYNSDMALESRESTPVTIKNVRGSNIYVNCDYNGDGKLPLFANSKTDFGMYGEGNWGCFSDDPELPECACFISCTVGTPFPDITSNANPPPIVDYSNLAPANADQPLCSELSSFATYQQWDVVLYSEDGGAYDLPDGGYDGYYRQVRMEVDTANGVPGFNPLDLEKPEHQQITFDITGMLEQIQAARPRWLIYARQPSDVCCHGNPHPDGDGGMTGICPDGVADCALIGQ